MEVPTDVQNKVEELQKLVQEKSLDDSLNDKAKQAFADFDDAISNGLTELTDDLQNSDGEEDDEEEEETA